MDTKTLEREDLKGRREPAGGRPIGPAAIGGSWPVAVAAAFAAAYFAYVHAYGVNVLFWDEWELVPLFRQFVEGSLRPGALLKATHNGNLMAAPFSVMLVLGALTGLANKAWMYLGAGMQGASFLVLWSLAKRRLPSDSAGRWSLAGLAAMMFSFCQVKNILWGFQTAWFMVTLGLMLTLLFLDKTEEREGASVALFSAALCAFMASFSLLQGLAVWAAGAAFLAAKSGRPLRSAWRDKRVAIWACLAASCGAAYYGLLAVQPEASSSLQSGMIMGVLSRPLYDARFLLSSWGALLAGSQPAAALVWGVALLGLLGWAVADVLGREDRSAFALPIALVVFALVFDAMLLVGRSGLGLEGAFDNHYTGHNLLLLVGLFLFFIHKDFAAARPLGYRAAKAAMFALLALFVVGNVYRGVRQGRLWRLEQGINSLMVRHLDSAPDFQVESAVFGSRSFVQEQAVWLSERYMNVYGDPAPQAPRLADLADPPKTLMSLASAPADADALRRLWDVYVIAPDLQKAFGVRSPSFAADLVRWAGAEAREKGHYLHRHLDPFGVQYIALAEKLGAVRGQ